MTIAILATVVSALGLLKDSEVMKMLDHDTATSIVKVRDKIKALHDKLHHQNQK